MGAENPVPTRSRRHLVRWILIAVLGLVVAMAVLFVRDAMAARDSFGAVMEDLPQVEQALLDGNIQQFDELVADLQQHTADARASTDGPMWWLAGKVPVVGANAAALTLVAEVIDDVAVDVLPNLGAASTMLTDGGLQFTDARLDLDPIRDAGTHLTVAYTTVVDCDDRLQDFDGSNLMDEIAGPFDDAVGALSELRSVVTAGHNLATLLPPMLGGDGPRQYLVLAQNNAELRSTGGIAGAVLLISADDGAIAMERIATPSDIGPFSEPVVEMRPADLEMYGEAPGRFVQDVTMLPQFPAGAPIAAEMWRQSQGETVDGVVAVDPVALSFLMEQIGPIEVEGATLDASNVVDVLLSQVYETHPDPAESDAVFAQAAAAIMSRVLGGEADAGGLLDAVTRAADERRLLIWSAHADEQAVLEQGNFASDFDDAPATVGIFFNDGTRGKMSFYLDTQVTFVESRCTADGRVDTFELRLASTLTPEQAESLPSYVTGVYLPTDMWGTIRTNVAFYSAAGGQVINITRDDGVIGGQFYDAEGRAVTVVTQDLAPDEAVTFRMDFLAAPGDVTGVTEMWTTPTTRTTGLHEFDVTYCPASS